MRKKLLIVALIMPLCVPISFAQSRKSLSMTIDELFTLIENNNTDIEVARRTIKVSEQNEDVAKANRLPEVSASLSLNYLGDATILDREFSDATRAEMPHFGNTFKISAYQPIYAGGAITGAIDLAKAQTTMSRLNFEHMTITTKFRVIECYLNLFKYRNLLHVYNQNIALTRKLIVNMKAKNSQGIVLKNDITRYELRLSTLQYDSTSISNNIHVMNYHLTSYLGLDHDINIIPDSILLSEQLPIENVGFWQSMANARSISIRQANAEHNIAVKNDKIIKSQMLPHIGIIAGNTLDGPITVEIPTINKNINYWWVGLNISYNISSIFKTNKNVKRSRLEIYRLNEKINATQDAVERDVERAYTQYIQAYEQLHTQQKNVELATENYRIVNQRFNHQLALLTDMLDASTSKLDAEIRLVNAHISTIFFYYQLKFISGTL